MALKKSKLAELLKDDKDSIPVDKPLSHYLPKPKGQKMSNLPAKGGKLEAAVKAECVKYLKERGWESITLYTGGIPIGYGKYAENPAEGIPDTIAKKVPHKVWIEYKREFGGIISSKQQWWHTWLRACGDIVFEINSLSSLKEQMNETFGPNY